MWIQFGKVFPEASQAMLVLERAVRKSSLEPALLELVRLRASQLNGCGYCIDMHTKDARSRGETEQRLYLTSAWREAPCYGARERAALEWTEALTLLPRTGAPDDVYERVSSCSRRRRWWRSRSPSWPSTAGTASRWACARRWAAISRRPAHAGLGNEHGAAAPP